VRCRLQQGGQRPELDVPVQYTFLPLPRMPKNPPSCRLFRVRDLKVTDGWFNVDMVSLL
jgi:hypothetical protein